MMNALQTINASSVFLHGLWSTDSSDFPSSYLIVDLFAMAYRLPEMELVFVPFICRFLAFMLLSPFLLCIGLDIIAYAIARTLRLSMLQARVPRSPTDAAASSGRTRSTFRHSFAQGDITQNPYSSVYDDREKTDSLGLSLSSVDRSSSTTLLPPFKYGIDLDDYRLHDNAIHSVSAPSDSTQPFSIGTEAVYRLRRRYERPAITKAFAK